MPGANCYGVIPHFADQPVLAESLARFRGEAVALVVGDSETIRHLDLATFPVTWSPLPALTTLDEALEEGAERIHPHRPRNILTSGRVARGDAVAGLAAADVVVEGAFETGFVEHAYIEPEAGFARRVGDRIEIQACTQAPYMDRDDVAKILGIAPEQVRIIPTAVGGGFGAKLDLSVQPFIAVAAWLLDRPVRMVYSRRESIMTTTKRHPARIVARIGATRDGRLAAMDFAADFNTGAYASWGPTVANRVPVHASGPYRMPHYRAAGARDPHASRALRRLSRLRRAAERDRAGAALRRARASPARSTRSNSASSTRSAPASRPSPARSSRTAWASRRVSRRSAPVGARRAPRRSGYNAEARGALRRGVGVAGMWYGCGNTSMSNPSTMRLGLKPNGRFALFQGAVDIGQGSNTVIAQICADALGAPIGQIDLVSADTDVTPDCGKTSASRQTFVSGNAAALAARAMRRELLRLANVGEDAKLRFETGAVAIADASGERRIELAAFPVNAAGFVVEVVETFDPPTTPLDENGQGDPYAVFGSGAHMAEIEVDVELGRVKVLRLVCAHDVGRAINPTLVEGQIEGGAAQGLGLALMEEFFPGKGENLHDYLIPTIGDMPPVECILIEDASSVGPFGAKGVGEQALIPTAPAIFNAIHHATGARIRRAPATPDRVRQAILAAAGAGA